MTKQEEIREGVESIIKDWIIGNYPIGSETFADLVKRVQIFEDSQGVVIKVERELPPPDITTDAFPQDCNEICHQIEQKSMLKAGYKATGPLV